MLKIRRLLQILVIVAIAIVAVAAIQKPNIENKTIILFESNKVAAAFAKGMPLIETNNFKVHASRRDAPGIAEIHTRDTDIFYFMEGSAVFVTGGKATETKTVAPNELRGQKIEGGEARQIGKGDIVIIPNGVPHWFKEVHGPLLYYVVKVSSADESK
jgi:mannose-6-phosphate isomerase-like protein (cupin superfamily)